MIIYSDTKEKLNSDIVAGTLAHKISDEFVARLHYSTGAAEYRSWENSLREMNAVLQMSALPDDVEIAVEFQIPLTSKRVDFMIAGLDENGQRNVVVVELKQWQQAQRTSRVRTGDHLCRRCKTNGYASLLPSLFLRKDH